MDRKVKRGIFIGMLLVGAVGAFLIYQASAPEVIYLIDKPREDEIQKAILDFHVEETLPEENRLLIPAIGVDMELGEDYRFLDFGGWVQFTNSNEVPQMIAVHRFGWDTLNITEKMKQTLYHVDKLQVGEVVLMHWEGEKYEYQVVEVYDGINNPPLKDDELILYTCKFFTGSERVFVKLV